MKNSKLENISEELFDTVEPDDCLTAIGGLSSLRTIAFTDLNGRLDVVTDVRADE
ncbi:MAG TPA: hypothetical protein VEZ90_17915 [Blastocatellia bacterium]|nr:hypothetical protein [Blastocatellia bacterium]